MKWNLVTCAAKQRKHCYVDSPSSKQHNTHSFMAMANTVTDNLHYLQSILLALIVSFLLAKLFSVIFSSGDHSNNNPIEIKPAENLTPADAEVPTAGDDDDDDDDWEGVETTELDAAFCAANAFVAAVAADRSAQKVAYDVKLKLYGLYKVATEGACSVPVPSAIKITARAKW